MPKTYLSYSVTHISSTLYTKFLQFNTFKNDVRFLYKLKKRNRLKRPAVQSLLQIAAARDFKFSLRISIQ